MRVINHVKTVKTDNKSKYRHFHCKSKQPSVKKTVTADAQKYLVVNNEFSSAESV